MMRWLQQALLAVLLLAISPTQSAKLGLDREAYGVFDRSGYNSLEEYPFLVGQEYQGGWEFVHPARNVYDWTELDTHLQFAYEQHQHIFVKVSPVSGNGEPPSWIYNAGVPQVTDGKYTYGYYLDADYKVYHQEMILALGNHLRNEIEPHLQELVAFVRVDTGATGDESPYEEANNVPPEYQITDQEWQEYRLWLFGVYDIAFQEGPSPQIPLLFQSVKPTDYPVEWAWVQNNINGGLGVKYAGAVRGHHLDQSNEVEFSFKNLAVDSDAALFSRNEMDQTWSKPYFQLNVRLGFYWCAVEQLHAGMSIWDVTRSALARTYDDDILFAFEFFNKWAAELVPATAGGGFCIFHEGLDSSDVSKFDEAIYGEARKKNDARYESIVAAYTAQGAQIDDLEAVMRGQVYQRANQLGYNDVGWKIVAGNYDRFITQIDPDNTSIGLWRIGGALSTNSHPYDRFARGFESASSKNTMYFDIHDDLLPTPNQSVRLTITYYDAGSGSFELQYDAMGDSRKSAIVVTKTNSGTWMDASVVITDWVFANNGPLGADLMLLNRDTEDDVFHKIEIEKLVDVTLSSNGQGSVQARHHSTTYDPPSGVYMEGTRLDLTATPASGWQFSHWSGDASGVTGFFRLYPTVNTQVHANFIPDGAETASSSDNFESNSWSGGEGWAGDWQLSGGTSLRTHDGNLSVRLSRNGEMTRALATPLSFAILSFVWDADSLDGSETAQAEVFDGTSWSVVWNVTKASNGDDNKKKADALAPVSLDLSSYDQPIEQIRFKINAGGRGDRLWIDAVVVNGYTF